MGGHEMAPPTPPSFKAPRRSRGALLVHARLGGVTLRTPSATLFVPSAPDSAYHFYSVPVAERAGYGAFLGAAWDCNARGAQRLRRGEKRGGYGGPFEAPHFH